MQIFNSRSLLALMIAMIGVACVKDPQDIPPGLTSDAVFGMTGQFGNQAINLDAGIDQWTFNPIVREADSILIYSSVLSQNGCIDQCPSSWTFNFYQAEGSSLNEAEKFNNTIKKGPVDFVLADAERDSFRVSVSTHPDLFMNGVSFWQNPGGSNVTYTNEFKETVGSNDVFDACFQSVVYAGCQYNQCIYFKPATLVPCLVHIEATVESGRYVVLTAVPEGTPPFHIQWQDGPSTSTQVVAAANLIQDIYADVTVTDANGNRAELVQTVRLQDSIVDACYYPINMVSTPFTDYAASLAAGDVEIIYRDANGEEWKSTKGVQPAESNMQIQDVSYYGIAPSGLPAYKTSLSVHVLLTNASTGESRWFDADDVVLPLAHPE
jgi:hypothetical protein